MIGPDDFDDLPGGPDDGGEYGGDLPPTGEYRPPRRTLGPEAGPGDPEAPFDLRLAMLGRTDFANGQRLFLRHGGDIRMVDGVGWLVWDGNRYAVDKRSNAVRRMAHETVAAIRDEAFALRKDDRPQDAKDLFGWMTASQSSARFSAMIREVEVYAEAKVDELDARDFVFNAADVSIDLGAPDPDDPDAPMTRTRPPARDDLITMKGGAPHDPAADCPTWRAFLEDILPDPEVRGFLRRWCGYLLTGSIAEQCMVILHGEGSNGKSTLVSTLAHVLGEYAVSVPVASLLHDDRKRGSEASPDIARLRAARLVMASEPDLGARFSESTIKQLTGGERVTARALREDFIEFRPTFKIMLSCNTKPQIRGVDDGIWRRIRMVEFSRQFLDHEKDEALPDRLQDEAAGILNWMIDGYCEWREIGLAVPQAVREQTDLYRESQDQLGAFIRAEIGRDAAQSVQANRLYRAYVAWCKANAEDDISQTLFGRRMTERGFVKQTSGVTVYRGIYLLHPEKSDGSEGYGAAGDDVPPPGDPDPPF